MGRLAIAAGMVLTVGTVTASANEGAPLETRGARKPIVSIRSSPPAVVPVDRRIRVQVEPHRDNRLLRVAIDADGYYRSTVIQLDGADAARTHYVTWRGVPPGSYVLTATVHSAHGVRGQHVERGGIDASRQFADWHGNVSDASPARSDRTD